MATPWQSRGPMWLSRGNPEAQMATPWQSRVRVGGAYGCPVAIPSSRWLPRGNPWGQMATPWPSRDP
eukprot:4730807-Pyramimonas_sp.AAC.1